MEDCQYADDQRLVAQGRGDDVNWISAAQRDKARVSEAVLNGMTQGFGIFIEPGSEPGANRHRFSGHVQDHYAGDLLAIFELVDQALEFAVGVILEQRLSGFR